MPLFDFHCDGCGIEFEELLMPEEPGLCPVCRAPSVKQVVLIADTKSRWGDSRGYFDRGLGCYVENTMHKEEVMAERGLVQESDLSSGHVDSSIQDSINESEQHTKTMARYNSNLDKYKGDPDCKARAVVDTFPQHEIAPHTMD